MSIRNFLFLFLLFLSTSAVSEDERLLPEKAMTWQPKEYEGAKLHPRIEFLEPAREWERMDVWVPDAPKEKKLPCVVAVYGGGYGEKSGGFLGDAKPLLERGFVVAAPDYALKTNAPVPLCSWDVAAAIRHLRANAERYRIDPERMGIWGWSAGGWIAQDLCYAGPERIVKRDVKVEGKKVAQFFPMLEPRPQNAEQSIRLQAVVSDWGAGKLWDKRKLTPQPWLSADDPPLFTIYNQKFGEDLINPAMLTRRLGIPSRAVYEMEGNTHVPSLGKEAVDESGKATTWGEGIFAFFEERLKHPDTATAPEMIPHGGAISGATEVRLLTVHPEGVIRYTLDGSVPGEKSPRFEGTVDVEPGQTLRAVAFREGLKPSRVTTGEFVEGPPRPRITTADRTFNAKVGKPWEIQFAAENAEGATWYVGGKVGEQYREFDGKLYNPPAIFRR